MKKISNSWITQWGKDYLSHLREIFQGKLTAGDNITIVDDVISASGGGAEYEAGDKIEIEDGVISHEEQFVRNSANSTSEILDFGDEFPVTTKSFTYDAYGHITAQSSSTKQYKLPTATAIYNAISQKQDALTAGTNITIDENNVISASGGGESYDDTELREYIEAIIDVLVDETYTPTSANASVGTPTGDCFTSNGIAYANIRFTTTAEYSQLSGRTKILDGFPVPRHSNSCHITMYDITNGDMVHGYIGATGGVYVMLPPSTGGNTFNINVSYPTTEVSLNTEPSVIIVNYRDISPINGIISDSIIDELTIIEPI